MLSIRRKLSIIIIICSISAIGLAMFFVNITIKNKFNVYMEDIQKKRYERIVSYFQQIYIKDKKWTKNSGIEIMHEAYMSNYCVTLMDKNKNVVWGMNPKDIKYKIHLKNMNVKNGGIYTSKRFAIRVNDKTAGYVDIGQYSSILMSEDDISFKNSVNKSIVISGFVAIVIIIAISLYFSKQFSVPIKKAADISVNLSKGNFNIRDDTRSKVRELEDLRASMNVLAEKLRAQDALRGRLVSDISHEIRTPLNVLQNNLEAMIDGIVPITQGKLEYLNEEVIRFGKLLNNLNTLKEFEAEGNKLSFTTVFLDAILKDIYKDFKAQADSKKIKFTYNADKLGRYEVIGDEDKLKQVFINLLSNSLKYTKQGGKIEIKLYEADNKVFVEVSDDGIGISEEDLPYIFERLYRGDRSRHKIEGTGIGLTIVKNILELHNANIEVNSSQENGSKFKINFNKI